MSLDAIAERAKKYQPKPKITYKMIQEYAEKKYGFRAHMMPHTAGVIA